MLAAAMSEGTLPQNTKDFSVKATCIDMYTFAIDGAPTSESSNNPPVINILSLSNLFIPSVHAQESEICMNGATNYPNCTFQEYCTNLSNNYPECNNVCENGKSNPPDCRDNENFCGDGNTRGDEQCDDGNDIPGDGCSQCAYDEVEECDAESGGEETNFLGSSFF
jgi:cysteine-rich repeat protein